jgi:hypothetical protein
MKQLGSNLKPFEYPVSFVEQPMPPHARADSLGERPLSKRRRGCVRRLAMLLLILLILGAAGAGAFWGYRTMGSSEGVIETAFSFSRSTVGSVVLGEPAWNSADADGNGIPDAVQNMMPLQRILKDPTVTNKSNISTWVFCTIQVPHALVSLKGADGTAQKAQLMELFTYRTTTGWTELEAAQKVTSNYVEHTYAWNSVLKPLTKTDPLFYELKVVNAMRIERAAQVGKIRMTGFGLKAEGSASALEAWETYAA